MKRKKRILGTLLMVTALVIMLLPAAEADAETSASGFQMEGSTLVKYRGTDKNVSIPNTVKTIGESAFEDNTNIELVVVPNSVESIEAYAFWGCDNLDTVVLGKGLTEISDYAFAGCKGLVQMTIPSTVKTIGIQAFADCVNMKDISIPAETLYIHETAFDGCARLKIHCDAGSAADVYAQAFYERQKEMAEYEDVPNYNPSDHPQNTAEPSPSPSPVPTEVPGNVLGSTQVVGNSAVVLINNLQPHVYETVPTPEPTTAPEASMPPSGEGSQAPEPSVQPSGESSSAPETSANPSGNGSSDPESSAQPSGDGSQASENGSAGSENKNSGTSNGKVDIPKYTIVDGKIVADQAYYRNQTLGDIVLPDGIQEVGQFAFARSTVTSVDLPKGVETIGYGAFYHCDSLGDVTIPDTVNCVEPKAFDHTLWVEEFYAGGNSGGNGTSDSDFLIEGGVLIAYRGNSANVSIPSGVRVIAGEAFLDHSEIESVTFPSSLVVIGEGAFEGCTKLSQISFGGNVEEIKDRAFYGNAMSEVSLPSAVKTVGLKAFGNAIVSYSGREAQYTYETSASRLSNADYRVYDGMDEGEAGVTVTGLENIFGESDLVTALAGMSSLSGADRSYVLTVKPSEDVSNMETAFRRSYQSALPEDMTVYDLTLTDESDIPLTKLGHQELTVILPVPEALKGQELRLFTLDRNGQLESLAVERVTVKGEESFRFRTTHLSPFGVCGAGEADSERVLMEISVQLDSLGEAPASGTFSGGQFWQSMPWQSLRLGAGGILMTAGILLCLSQSRRLFGSKKVK